MEFNKEELNKEYQERLPFYKRNCENIVQALKIFLGEAKINFLTVTSRIKDFESFYEKIDRKKYKDPFQENEDFCGIRIILYFIDDIDFVKRIIEKEFNIKEEINKSDILDVNKFGYRSHHFIITLQKDWIKSPNYRGLDDIKTEIQVRTILMHTWAEIEHELGYKYKDRVPDQLKRKLSTLSAKLEDADEQFKELKNSIRDYTSKILNDAKETGDFIFEEFNLNSFQAFLDYYYPKYERRQIMTQQLFDNILKSNINKENLIEFAERFKEYTDIINLKVTGSKRKTTQTNIFSYAIDALYTKRYKDASPTTTRMEIINQIKQMIK